MKNCPFCNRPVEDNAVRCSYQDCGKEFKISEQQTADNDNQIVNMELHSDEDSNSSSTFNEKINHYKEKYTPIVKEKSKDFANKTLIFLKYCNGKINHYKEKYTPIVKEKCKVFANKANDFMKYAFAPERRKISIISASIVLLLCLIIIPFSCFRSNDPATRNLARINEDMKELDDMNQKKIEEQEKAADVQRQLKEEEQRQQMEIEKRKKEAETRLLERQQKEEDEQKKNESLSKKTGKVLIAVDNVCRYAKGVEDYMPNYYDNPLGVLDRNSSFLFWRCIMDPKYFKTLEYCYPINERHLVRDIVNKQETIQSEIKRSGFILKVHGYNFYNRSNWSYVNKSPVNPNKITIFVEFDKYCDFKFNHGYDFNYVNIDDCYNSLWLSKDYYHILMKDNSFKSIAIPSNPQAQLHVDDAIGGLLKNGARIYYDDTYADTGLCLTISGSPEVIKDLYTRHKNYCMECFIENVFYKLESPVIMYSIEYINQSGVCVNLDKVKSRKSELTIESNAYKQDIIGGTITAFQIRNVKTNKIIASANSNGQPIHTTAVDVKDVIDDN